ncbi:DnaB-like helicase C-terminal domain-containing protein [Paratractidigestivibacter sp.]|uniref:DnaB-like helicase C-terminal domain-containing protein n=1 Tax=Paratractidigestivibacter sp. TaxID=2847316 RepID=UPI002ABE27EF|nr:DnaB-like helicase C-terminal domain-containing protein [Paratractidigestivibacter sp.]
MSTTVTDRNRFDRDDLIYLLDQVSAATVDYGEWLSIGAGLKEAGCTLADWSAWSATDTDRYNSSEMAAKWESFAGNNASGARADAETVARICFKHNAKEKDLPLVPSRANEYKPRTFQPSTAPATAGVAAPTPVVPAPVVEKPAEPEPDYSEGRKQHREYIACAVAAMTEGCDGWRYLTARGLTAETIRAERIGWNPSTRSVVLPYSAGEGEYYHIDRKIYVDTHTRHKYNKPPETKPNRRGDLPVGSEPIFCPQDLEDTSEVVFVVEGGFDVYALHQLGYKAAGVISAHAYGRIVDALKTNGYRGTVVALLDNDATGNKAADAMCKALEEAGIEHMRGTQTPGTNDASEALEECPERFKAHMRNLYARAVGGLYDPAQVADGIVALAEAEEPTPTGVKPLDDALGGGIRQGVTVLAALSSLGKTTLMIQIADNIAASGRPVLFVTIEQSAKEIVSKSIVRFMFEQHQGKEGRTNASDLNSPKVRATWSAKKRQILENAVNDYKTTVAPNMTILQAPDRPSADYIVRSAQKIAQAKGEPPVIFVDYLQLMAPRNERDTDKMTADNNMRELRQMARELATPVFIVSSINRNSYAGDMHMSALKESGGVEYSADVVLGLQVEGIKEKLTYENKNGEVKHLQGEAKTEKANAIYELVKKKPVRRLEIKVLKNRNGAMPNDAPAVTFYAAECCFAATEKAKPKKPEKAGAAKAPTRSTSATGGAASSIFLKNPNTQA